ENPADVRQRWIAMKKHMKLKNIDVHFLEVEIKLSKDMDRIAAEVKGLGGVDLVVVDTVRAYYEGDDENDNVQMGEYARRLRSLRLLEGGPTVLVLCHPPKNCPEDQLQPVGGGAFVAEMDANLTCTGDGDIATVHWYRKIRGPDFMPLKFGLKKDVTADQ